MVHHCEEDIAARFRERVHGVTVFGVTPLVLREEESLSAGLAHVVRAAPM